LPTFSFEVSQLQSGIYWLEIYSGDKILRSKFIKSSVH